MTFSDEVGFLLIHGLGGNKKIMSSLEDFLKQKNAVVVSENLPGHNTNPEDLRKTKWEEWVEFSQDQLNILKKESKQIFIVGTSLGGVISLHIASQNPEIDGLILCSTALKPFNLKSWVVYNVPFLHYIVRWVPMKNLMLRYMGVPRSWRIYKKIPVESLKEGVKLLKEAKPNLNKISQPVLILHSKNDKLVPFRTTKQITSTISSDDVTVSKIDKGGHVMLGDSGCDLAIENIYNWVIRRI